MFSFFKQSSRIEALESLIREHEHKIKEMLDSIEKLEIKALESRKLYHRKLKELYTEEEDKGKDIYNGVLLKENGNN